MENKILNIENSWVEKLYSEKNLLKKKEIKNIVKDKYLLPNNVSK